VTFYYFIVIFISDIHTVEVELGQEVYPHDRIQADTERVDHLMVMARVGVLNIIQKVRLRINLFICLSLISVLKH